MLEIIQYNQEEQSRICCIGSPTEALASLKPDMINWLNMEVNSSTTHLVDTIARHY